MLRPGENVLYFPVDHPKVDLEPFKQLKAKPGEYWAVLDPPREKSAGGVHLLCLEDGWSENPLDVDEGRAEEAYKDAVIELQQWSKVCRESTRVTHSMRRKWDRLYETAVAAHEAYIRVIQDKGPGAALEERPDSYTVVSVGEGVPFTPGDRVMLAPFAPRRLQELFGVPDVCLIGYDDPWEDITPLVWNPLNQTWELTDNWVALKIHREEVAVEVVRHKYVNIGTVLSAGPKAESLLDDTVVLHRDRTLHRPDDTKWFATKYGPWDGLGVLLVREVDSEGERRILGTLVA